MSQQATIMGRLGGNPEMKNTGKGGGLTLPLGDGEGQYIAKFPSTAFPGVSENEFANLALAEAIGMEVPERELVSRDQFEGIPEEFETLAEGLVLLVRRFDRGVEYVSRYEPGQACRRMGGKPIS